MSAIGKRLVLILSLLVVRAVAAEPATGRAERPNEDGDAGLQKEISELRSMVTKLQSRVEELERRGDRAASGGRESATDPTVAAQPTQETANVSQSSSSSGMSGMSASGAQRPFPAGSTLSFFLDANYNFNFNQPIGRVNLLRAYDVFSQAVNINQSGLIFERQPDPEHGSRFGLRFDLQYGQATQTLAGNSANEPRPDIYRNIYQAYGTYVAPLGRGLTLDLGKFASSLGYEGNYTKDQINYSRSFWFNFLPFYHSGLRASYKVNDAVTLNYWLVNGTNQSEPYNGFKDEFFGLALTPAKNLSWNIQYYFGQDHPDTVYFPYGGAPANSPNLQGLAFLPINHPPTGKLHIFDTFATWNVTPKLTVGGEADDFVERLYTNSIPDHTIGGAAYLKYQFTKRFYLGARGEYLSDRGGLFTGATQAVKDTTFTLAYRPYEGFEVLGEWRRDSSNQPYFYTGQLGVFKREQNTAIGGFLWWFGGKEGMW